MHRRDVLKLAGVVSSLALLPKMARATSLMAHTQATVYEGIEDCDIYALDNHGQSQAQGVGHPVALTTDQPYGNLSFNGGVRPGDVDSNMTGVEPLVEYNRPTGDQPPGGYAGETGLASWANELVALEQAASGTPWYDQISRYFAWFGGTGGRPIGNFMKGYSGWDNWMLRLQAAAKVMATAADGGSYGYLVTSWQQGEADMSLQPGGATSMQAYLSLLLTLEEEIWTQGVQVAFPQQTWRPLFIIGQLAAHNTYGSPNKAFCNPAIAVAQWLAAKQSSNIRIANPQYPYDFYSQAGSTVLHFTAHGHELQGKYFARLTRQLMADRKALRPLGNYSVEMLSAKAYGNKIKVVFNVPEPPLVIDTDWVQAARSYGFGLYDEYDNYLNIISHIWLAGPQSIVIETFGNILPGTRLWAGRGIPSDGPGIGRGHNTLVPAGARVNLRDSAGNSDQYIGSDGTLRRLDNWCIIHYIDVVRSA